jgi:hypothetical protein
MVLAIMKNYELIDRNPASISLNLEKVRRLCPIGAAIDGEYAVYFGDYEPRYSKNHIQWIKDREQKITTKTGKQATIAITRSIAIPFLENAMNCILNRRKELLIQVEKINHPFPCTNVVASTYTDKEIASVVLGTLDKNIEELSAILKNVAIENSSLISLEMSLVMLCASWTKFGGWRSLKPNSPQTILHFANGAKLYITDNLADFLYVQDFDAYGEMQGYKEFEETIKTTPSVY